MGRSKFIYKFIMMFYKPYQLLEKSPLLKHNDSEENTSGHMIPINTVVREGKNIVLPLQILRPLIESSECVAIMSECLCRRGEGCTTYPQDLGCLLLGSAARDLHPGLGRIVSSDEAIVHAENALQLGLVPLILHNEFDAWIWGIDYRRMMNVCFCCDCCCAVRRNIRNHLSRGFFKNIHRLPGLTVSTNDRCTGCGLCVEECLASAIEIEQEKAIIDQLKCKGCGRCITRCPEDAISMSLDPTSDPIRNLLKIYGQRTSVGFSEGD